MVKLWYCVLVMGPSLENSHLSICDLGLPVSRSHVFLHGGGGVGWGNELANGLAPFERAAEHVAAVHVTIYTIHTKYTVPLNLT